MVGMELVVAIDPVWETIVAAGVAGRFDDAGLDSVAGRFGGKVTLDEEGCEAGDGTVVDHAAGLTALLEVPDPTAGLELSWRSGLLAAVVPEVAALELDDEIAAMHKDNLAHTFKVVAMVPARLRVRLTALFHDVGKPPTRAVVAGAVSFHGHEEVGARLTRKRLTELGFDEQLIDDVVRLVRVSGRLADFEGNWTDSAVRRMVRDADGMLDDLCDFVSRDCTSRHEIKRLRAAERVAQFRALADDVARSDEEAARRPALDGDTIMAILGIEPGREVGAARRYLLELAEAGETLDAGEAERRLRAWWADRIL